MGQLSKKTARAEERAQRKQSRQLQKAKSSAIRQQLKMVRKISKLKVQEALKDAKLQWETAAGRGASALTCVGIEAGDVVVTHFEEARKPSPGGTHVPGQIVAVDYRTQCVVVALRGTSCLRDALADLDCTPQEVILNGQ